MTKVYVECNADQALVECLYVPVKCIDHSRNKGNVSNKLQASFGAIGLVDQDPKAVQPKYLDSLQRDITVNSTELGFEIRRDEVRNNVLIVLIPNLEKMLLKCANDSAVEIVKFNLLNEPKLLHDIAISKIPELRRFIKELLRVENESMVELKKYLEN